MSNIERTERESVQWLESILRKKISKSEREDFDNALKSIKEHVFKFKDITDIFLDAKVESGHFTTSTAKNYRYLYGKYMADLLEEDVRIVTVKSTLESWKNEIVSRTDIKGQQKQRIIRCMASLVQYGYYLKVVSDGDYKDSKLVLVPPKCRKALESEKKNRVVWSPEEIKAFINTLPKKKGEMDRVSFRLLLATGLRVGEILGLRTDSIDYEHDMVIVDHQVYRDSSEHDTKNGDVRMVYIPHELVVMVKEYIKARHIKD